MKRAIFFILCMIATIIVLGQEEKQRTIQEVVIIASQPKFTGVAENFSKSADDGLGELNQYIANNIQRLEHPSFFEIEGTEVIRFVVTKTGDVTDLVAVNSLNPDIDKEVMRVLKTTSGMWKPGSDNNGKIIPVEKEVSFNFIADGDNPSEKFTKVAQTYFKLGNQKFFNKNKNKAALKCYDNAVQYRPNDKGLLAARGLCKYQLGDKTGACKDWYRIRSLGGYDGEPYLNNFCEFDGYAEMMSTIQEKK